MDNVFDAQYFGGSVHGVLLMVWVSFIRRKARLKKTGFRISTQKGRVEARETNDEKALRKMRQVITSRREEVGRNDVMISL